MRYPSLLAQRRGVLEVAMTPMVDVVFMLLIFFVWTASFRVAELSLPSSLITQEQGQGNVEVDPELEDLDRVVVRLGWSGTQPLWTINDVPVASLQEVRQRLDSVAEIKANLPVLVDPMAEVPLGHVIDVYDLARQAGFESVQFAVEYE